jgi:hypothetical protein
MFCGQRLSTRGSQFCARLGYVASGGWRPVSPVAGGLGRRHGRPHNHHSEASQLSSD